MATAQDIAVEGTFVVRLNRFAADVLVDGRPALAHVPNSGRMTELLVEGASVMLHPAAANASRRTAYDLVAVRHAGRWVGVDSRMPPALAVDAWRSGMLRAFAGYTSVRREVRFGESRLDLLFEGPAGLAYVEAKSVNLVERGVGLFPDAPTTRGTRHLRELAEAVRQGHRAAVVFVVQRDDVRVLRPHADADPDFARTLGEVVVAGVEAYAIACTVSADAIAPARLVPVEVAPGVVA